MRSFTVLLLMISACCLASAQQPSKSWNPNKGNEYINPVINADYSDPDVCRVGDDYYMTASSFGCFPGLQILHSTDLVNWEIIGAALTDYPGPNWDDEASWFTSGQNLDNPVRDVPGAAEWRTIPQHGNGVYAPSIRYHNGEFYIYCGDPDRGIFMVKTSDPRGRWDDPVWVVKARGYIDPCPFWDEDGKAYLSHGCAGSRVGIKSVLLVAPMSPDGTRLLGASRIVYDGHETQPTIEGTKFYKRNGKYYIFSPAGGVPTGWQTVLRSDNPFGPYEERVVIAQGNSKINGPHQGAWVDTPTGEHWFLHFQDVGAYGRLVHLQPMTWKDGWPVMGVDKDGDGCGEPVMKYKKPNVGKNYPVNNPRESDEFDGYELGKQWQWHANFNEKWHYCAGQKGVLRLFSYPEPEGAKSLWDVPNLLMQKPTAPNFTCTTKLKFTTSDKYLGERTGLVVMGLDYAGVVIENTEKGLALNQVVCLQADKGKLERIVASVPLESDEVYLRAQYRDKGLDKKNPLDMVVMVEFSYSLDGKRFTAIGEPFRAKEGKWIGAKTGVFCTRPAKEKVDGGWVDVDFFRVTK